jgi:hypothetical protein
MTATVVVGGISRDADLARQQLGLKAPQHRLDARSAAAFGNRKTCA